MTEINRSAPRSPAPGRFVLWLAAAFVLLVVDRITKVAVIDTLAYGAFVPVTPFSIFATFATRARPFRFWVTQADGKFSPSRA